MPYRPRGTVSSLIAATLAVACGPPIPGALPDAPPPPPIDAAPPPPDVDRTPDAEIPVTDCDNLPAGPLPFNTISITSGAEDFVFDRDGNLVLVDRWTGDVIKVTKDGVRHLFVPGIGTYSSAGTRMLANGDIVVADEAGPIVKVTPQGGVSQIVTNYSGFNGLVVGMDDKIYGASYQHGVVRTDPVASTATLLVSIGDYAGVDGITFSPDYETIYFNEGEIYSQGDGRLFRMRLLPDGTIADLTDLGRPLMATQGTLDGMTTDVCGNVYIAASWIQTAGCAASALVRVLPEGGPGEILACLPGFTPSLNFGSGFGGWDPMSIYVIDWGGSVYEVPVGVMGKPEPHLQ
jgi:sugar lactone lactonase YvrE